MPGVHAVFCDPKTAATGPTSGAAGNKRGRLLSSTPRWPETWEFVDSPANETPADGLIEVSPTSDEYWQVHTQLRAPTECGWGSMDDAWISKLERVQNRQLYSFFDIWAYRLESVARATGSTHMLSTTNSG